MLSLLERIPSTWIALILAGFAASLSMRIYTATHPAKNIVRGKIWNAVLIYIVLSRFSGLILHPSVDIMEDVRSLLSGTSSTGWLLGTAASVIYVITSLWRAQQLNRDALTHLFAIVAAGSVLYHAYLALINLNPFRMEDILRAACSLGFFVWFLRAPILRRERPQYWWGLYGVMLLITSSTVPQPQRIFVFSAAQWMFIAVIMISIYSEIIDDIFTGRSSVNSHEARAVDTHRH